MTRVSLAPRAALADDVIAAAHYNVHRKSLEYLEAEDNRGLQGVSARLTAALQEHLTANGEESDL